MQSPPFPRYLVPPRSKYSPQHHILKHPQLPLLPQCQRPSFTPIQNNKSQRDALFLNFILVKNSTWFEQIYCPSSGVLILYSQLWYLWY